MGQKTLNRGRSLDDDGHCFACGKENPAGLRMEVTFTPEETARCEITLDRRYQGWKEVIHGGIVTTLLDEVMAYAVLEFVGQGVTTGIEVRYAKPVRVGQRVIAEGRVDERRKLIRLSAKLTDADDGAVLATAKSNFMPIKNKDA